MLREASHLREGIVEGRRDLHMNPEFGFREFHTSKNVAAVTERLGHGVRRKVGRTGVVCDIGDDGGPWFALRPDMGDLPVAEANGAPCRSQNEGVMHACGQDSHVAMALGAATLIARHELPGKVRFIFQPSEETADEQGISGAPRMIEDGAMEPVDIINALHVDPSTRVGEIHVSAGASSGGVDSWFGRILGKGGHGAKLHETVDPFHRAAHAMIAPNSVVSRRLGMLMQSDPRLLHHPRLDLDISGLPIGAAVLAEAALRFFRTAGNGIDEGGPA
jgi:amidohydrolase